MQSISSLFHKYILIIYFLTLDYLANRTTWLHVKLLLTATYVASVIKSLIVGFTWIRSCFNLVRLILLCVLWSYWSWNSTPCFFINFWLLRFFGLNFYYFLKPILTFLILHHRLPFLALSMNQTITEKYIKITYD